MTGVNTPGRPLGHFGHAALVMDQQVSQPGRIGVKAPLLGRFDFSLAANYRPLGVDNCIVTPGIQLLIPTGGFKDLSDEDALFAFVVNAVIVL